MPEGKDTQGEDREKVRGSEEDLVDASKDEFDDEDIDADNVLNLTTAERDQEQWQRYVVNLADQSKFTRQGVCSQPRHLAGQPTGPRDNVCWVFFRIPFKSPDDSLGHPLLRRAKALRILGRKP